MNYTVLFHAEIKRKEKSTEKAKPCPGYLLLLSFLSHIRIWPILEENESDPLQAADSFSVEQHFRIGECSVTIEEGRPASKSPH
jgi:hypothetical protein